MCGVDLCVSQLGMGFNISLGTKAISFYGLVNVPDILDIFISAHVHGQNGMALSFQDVASGYNDLVGTRFPHLNPQSYPADWGLKNLDFYLAPESGTFDGIVYTPGFYMIGGFVLLGVDCDVNVSITPNDFWFHVNYSVDTFNQMLNNEIGAQMALNPHLFANWPVDVRAAYLSGSNRMPDGSGPIVQVTAVSLHTVSCNYIAQGGDPKFKMDYVFWGNSHLASLDVAPLALYSDFAYFFKTYLANLFS